MTYTCKKCGALAQKPGHLCSPCDDKEKCSFCGKPDAGPRHVCKKKMAVMSYVCKGCGRVAVERGNLCKPKAIPV